MGKRFCRSKCFSIGVWPQEGVGLSVYGLQAERIRVGHSRRESFWLSLRQDAEQREYVQKGADRLFLADVQWCDTLPAKVKRDSWNNRKRWGTGQPKGLKRKGGERRWNR